MVAQQPPDLILLDIMMPGMDGYQVAAKIKGNPATKNIPVIMVTALDDRNARMLGLSAGAEDFLTKPVDRAELCVRVRNLLRLKAYGDYHDKYSQMLEGEVGSRTADLVESEARFRQLAETIREVFFLIDPQLTQILYVSPAYQDVFGRSCESLYADARSWVETVHPDDRERLLGERAPRAPSSRSMSNSGSSGPAAASASFGRADSPSITTPVKSIASPALPRTSPNAGRSKRRSSRQPRWTRLANWLLASPMISTTC